MNTNPRAELVQVAPFMFLLDLIDETGFGVETLCSVCERPERSAAERWAAKDAGNNVTARAATPIEAVIAHMAGTLGHCAAGDHLVPNDELVGVEVMAATHLSPAEHDEVCLECLERIAEQPDHDPTDPRI